MPELLQNLPVEFDASRRAHRQLLETGLISPKEEQVVGKVLNAAAMTYVAATLTSILQLLFFLIRAGTFRRGRKTAMDEGLLTPSESGRDLPPLGHF